MPFQFQNVTVTANLIPFLFLSPKTPPFQLGFFNHTKTLTLTPKMQQPLKPNSTNDENPTINTTTNNKQSKNKMKMPTPQELITHYESQGMATQEASIKVIDDLQHLLFRVVTSGRGKKDKFMAEASRKLDTANARLAIVEMKLDSKPGYPQSFAIGVAGAAAFRGVAAVWPQVAGAAAKVWDSVRGVTDVKP